MRDDTMDGKWEGRGDVGGRHCTDGGKGGYGNGAGAGTGAGGV
jgi:hypothetical protein